MVGGCLCRPTLTPPGPTWGPGEWPPRPAHNYREVRELLFAREGVDCFAEPSL